MNKLKLVFLSLSAEKVNSTAVAALMVAAEGTMSLKEISDICGITAAATTGTIDSLVEKGFVTKALTNDRRVRKVIVTEKGREFIRRLEDIAYA